MRLRRIAPSVSVILAMLLALVPALHAETVPDSDTGTITVQIVPPGSPSPTPEAKAPEAELPGAKSPESKPLSAPGTLSAALMWLPDSALGQTRLHGLLAVQDHRARANGWTIRLLGGSSGQAHLVEVTVGEAGFDLPDWVYEDIHAWDVAVGASMAESPQVVTAPPNRGYSLTIHQLWVDVEVTAAMEAGAKLTLVLILPAAP